MSLLATRLVEASFLVALFCIEFVIFPFRLVGPGLGLGLGVLGWDSVEGSFHQCYQFGTSLMVFLS